MKSAPRSIAAFTCSAVSPTPAMPLGSMGCFAVTRSAAREVGAAMIAIARNAMRHSIGGKRSGDAGVRVKVRIGHSSSEMQTKSAPPIIATRDEKVVNSGGSKEKLLGYAQLPVLAAV